MEVGKEGGSKTNYLIKKEERDETCREDTNWWNLCI